MLAGKLSAFTGNSGVGKSSILNALTPPCPGHRGDQRKLGRGRHTTRHVEFFPVAGGLIADTPASPPLTRKKAGRAPDKDTLAETFREFRPYLGQCRFVGCAHVKEAGLCRTGGGEGGEDLSQPPPQLRSAVRPGQGQPVLGKVLTPPKRTTRPLPA